MRRGSRSMIAPNLMFVLLQDATGTVQLVVRDTGQLRARLAVVALQSVLCVRGTVVLRPAELANTVRARPRQHPSGMWTNHRPTRSAPPCCS